MKQKQINKHRAWDEVHCARSHHSGLLHRPDARHRTRTSWPQAWPVMKTTALKKERDTHLTQSGFNSKRTSTSLFSSRIYLSSLAKSGVLVEPATFRTARKLFTTSQGKKKLREKEERKMKNNLLYGPKISGYYQLWFMTLQRLNQLMKFNASDQADSESKKGRVKERENWWSVLNEIEKSLLLFLLFLFFPFYQLPKNRIWSESRILTIHPLPEKNKYNLR